MIPSHMGGYYLTLASLMTIIAVIKEGFNVTTTCQTG